MALYGLQQEIDNCIKKGIETPFFLTDIDLIKTKYANIKDAFPNFEVFYAMKANPEVRIIEALNLLNARFEVTSVFEFEILSGLGINPNRIICLNPIKDIKMISYLYKKGVTVFAIDSNTEALKFKEVAPDAKLVVRLVVENKGSDWPLTRKFGLEENEAVDLVKAADMYGLNVIGITTHVGSQCYSLENWENGVLTCSRLWNKLVDAGYKIHFFSLGGGLPIKHTKNIPTYNEIGNVVTRKISETFNTIPQCSIEPGRGVVGDSTILVTTVIGTALRNGTKWAYLDAEVFHGLMETVEKFRYEILAYDNDTENSLWTLAGPSCDSVDIIMEDVRLPNNLQIGDKLLVLNTGAYTGVYGTSFNGFISPHTIYVARN